MSSILKPLDVNDANQVANLHIAGISAGFISSLGIKFVTALYEAIADNKYSFGFVVVDNKVVLGFVAFTTNIASLYKSIILKNGLRFGFLLAGKLVSFKRIKKVFETIIYPSRIEKLVLPKAELLSIAISDAARGRGLATQLTQRGFAECSKRGIEDVKVLVASMNSPANKLYLKCGFTLAGQIDNHGVVSNIYTAQTKGKGFGHVAVNGNSASI